MELSHTRAASPWELFTTKIVSAYVYGIQYCGNACRRGRWLDLLELLSERLLARPTRTLVGKVAGETC